MPTTHHSSSFREATPADAAFLEQMCYEAAFPVGEGEEQEVRPTFEEAMDTPWVREYVEDWGRTGDYGVIARDESGTPVGAAWYREYTRDDTEKIPPYELSIAVTEGYRGQAVGEGLLERLIEQAKTDEITELSLQVKEDNAAAKRLYEKFGFRTIGSEDGYDTMTKELT
jgi:ribosomal protein S18 acetylase RimI-like enzyme